MELERSTGKGKGVCMPGWVRSYLVAGGKSFLSGFRNGASPLSAAFCSGMVSVRWIMPGGTPLPPGAWGLGFLYLYL